MGWSDPNLTGPHVTVLVFRRVTVLRSSQYCSIGPKISSRSPDLMDGVQRMSVAAVGYEVDYDGMGRCDATENKKERSCELCLYIYVDMVL